MAQFKLYLGLLLLLLAPITPSHYLAWTRENVTFTQKTKQSSFKENVTTQQSRGGGSITWRLNSLQKKARPWTPSKKPNSPGRTQHSLENKTMFPMDQTKINSSNTKYKV